MPAGVPIVALRQRIEARAIILAEGGGGAANAEFLQRGKPTRVKERRLGGHFRLAARQAGTVARRLRDAIGHERHLASARMHRRAQEFLHGNGHAPIALKIGPFKYQPQKTAKNISGPNIRRHTSKSRHYKGER